MKISELKQPYRRMADYMVTKHYIQQASDGIYNFYKQGSIMDLFCNAVDNGNHPEITPEIKTHFPADFDFSGEDAMNKFELHTRDKFKEVEIPFDFNIFNSMLKNEVKNTFYLDAKKHYTQLAQQGKFDELPATCEFSEPLELEVFGFTNKKIQGKFKGFFVDIDFKYHEKARIPTPKIDFSQFKTGDVVEINYGGVNYVAYFNSFDSEHNTLHLSFDNEQTTTEGYAFNLIKSITKIK